jgi:hypothetical protein
MTNNPTVRLLLAAALVVTLTVSAQAATKDQYNAVLGSYVLLAYEHVCKPGSLNPEAKKLVELILDNSSSDLKSRVQIEMQQQAKKLGGDILPNARSIG